MAQASQQGGDPIAHVPLLPCLWRGVLLVATALVLAFLSLVEDPPGPSPTAWGLPSEAAHVLMYTLLAFLVAYALARWQKPPARKAALVFLVTLTYGAGLETAQLFRATRTFALTDLGANALGAGLGCTWALIEPRLAYRRVRLPPG